MLQARIEDKPDLVEVGMGGRVELLPRRRLRSSFDQNEGRNHGQTQVCLLLINKHTMVERLKSLFIIAIIRFTHRFKEF